MNIKISLFQKVPETPRIKRFLEKKLEKNMKKIQKQIEKEKLRVSEKKEEAAKRKAERELKGEFLQIITMFLWVKRSWSNNIRLNSIKVFQGTYI